MKLILKQDVEKLGAAGEIVTVKDGYGRNYLVPQGYAVLATPGAIRSVQEEARQKARKADATKVQAEEVARQIAETSLTISVTAGEDGKIFGTVTNQMLGDALTEKGFNIDRRKITIDSDVKNLGEFTATIDLHTEVKATLKFWVVKED
ncbi:MAG: 50S ribosomal protein L9 [Candidatus Cyclonatronum sp.]|uniref:50S ribosomal protein L9 n=1 Tax=Cyclonatronum sp. TaxID=3024185 RepID=UPI0025C39C9F|nr:50S ribosomal protein L9 [Cyclonatronum sp.]MCC5933213.1 50S ribosomal protein L9 [Balneolales bacterium]MCH8485887.1 50S ribosomal protein L9 [Cyclonatronum sp.]